MIRCADCALTISELPFTLEVDLRAVEHGGLCCPACGARAPLKAPLAELGVFSRQGRLCRWVEQGDPSLLRIGRMGLRLLDVEALDLRRVSYPALPLLLGRDGRPNTSLLPIRPEYADLIEAVEQAPRALGRVCTVGLRLRGRPGLTLLERPLTEPIPGLRVALWPDVPLTEWRFYLLGAWLDEASVLEGHVLELSSGAAALSLRPGATRAVAQLEGRPGAVGLRLTTADRFEAGGIFLVPQASRGLPATGRVVVGLDFGTSNTHLAWAAGDDLGSSIAAEIKAVPWADRDRVLHDGAERPTGRLGPETWPPVQGFDPAASTFPSALLCARPAASLDPSARGWRLGEDYGLVHIPAVGESPALPYDEGEHLVTNLKWDGLSAV